MTDPLTAVQQLSWNDWTALGAFVGAGAAVSVVIKFVTHYRAPKWAHPQAMARFAVTAASMITAAANYILSSPSKPLSVILAHFAIILTAAHLWYWISVNPSYKWLIGLLQDAAKWRAATAPQPTSAAAGAVPPEQFPA